MNFLYYGDNTEIMCGLPDSSVDLCYIDPPFYSQRVYSVAKNELGYKQGVEAFTDVWEPNFDLDASLTDYAVTSSAGEKLVNCLWQLGGLEVEASLLGYLFSVSTAVVEIHRLLKPTGSFYLHCDPTASHYLKLMLDAIFDGNFRNEIIWCYRGAGYPKNDFGSKHDTIFRYSKSKKNYTFNTDAVRIPYAAATVKRFKHKIGNVRGGADYGQQSLHPKGRRPDDWWEIQPIAPSAKERLGYPTQKPEALLERIILASSNEGDTVLDAYCGCGTTVAVAERLKRNWIGIDMSDKAINFTQHRLHSEFSLVGGKDYEVSGLPESLITPLPQKPKTLF